MNQVYLNKLVQQEAINVKIQLVREHINLAKNELYQIHENVNNINKFSLLTEQDETDTGVPWRDSNKQAKEFINNFPDKNHVNIRRHGQNPVSYEVEVEITPLTAIESDETLKLTKHKNLFRFYDDGSVYDFNVMTTFGWKFANGKLEIRSANPAAFVSIAKDRVLATIDANGIFTNIGYSADAADKSMFDKPKEIPWLDTVQTVLDWAGLIPVIGDALDIINACIYFWRGKYFEGFLSLLAIIPVIGSVMSLGIKGSLKAAKASMKGSKLLGKLGMTKLIRKWWVAGDKKAAQELGEQLLKIDSVSPSMLTKISRMFRGFGSNLTKASKSAEKIVGTGKATREISGAGKKISKGADGIDEAVDTYIAAEKAAQAAKNAAKEGAKIWKVPKAALNFLSFGLLPKIRKMPWFPQKQLTEMAEVTRRRFIARATKRPDRLGALTQFAGTRGKRRMDRALNSRIKSLGKKDQSRLIDALKNDTPFRRVDRGIMYNEPIIKSDVGLSQYIKKDNVIDFEQMFKNPADTEAFFSIIQNNKQFKNNKVITDLSEVVTDRAVKDSNPLWHMYRDDIGNKLISSQWTNTIQLQFAKNVDWIWNELQAAGETLGFESSEHLKQFGIVPFTKWAVAEVSPGGYKTMQEVRDLFITAIGMGSDVAVTALETVGIQIEDLEEYPPLGADEYTYKADEVDNTEESE